MISLEQIKELAITSPSKIVLLVIDGLGGLPYPETRMTELETARTPNLDRLASEGNCGLIDPVSPGITPGSAPAHLALFGYDPFKYVIGRGILETVGIEFPLQEGDIAARGNFCTVNGDGLILDRRAGRISTEKCTEICRLLNNIKVPGLQLFVSPVKGHRFVAVFRGANLHANISDSDPNQENVMPKRVVSHSPEAENTTVLVNRFLDQAKSILKDFHPANMLLLRGFSKHPDLPSMSEVYKLKPVAIATYPMYRGLAKLVGMDIVNSGESIKDEFLTLGKYYSEYDFFFIHIKGADAAGEDGDFKSKVSVIEEVDTALPLLTKLNPDVIVVTGDHSTPATIKGHSWHPVPFLLCSRWCRTDDVKTFSEKSCAAGCLGRFPTLDVMPLAMANAQKLTKFGA